MYPQPYPPPRRGVPGPIVVFIVIGCLLFGTMFGFGLGVVSAGSPTSSTSGQSEQTGPEPVAADTPSGRRSSPEAKPTKTAKPTPDDSFGDGTHRVGKDIRPGTYRTKGGEGCYWARLRDFKGELDSIIANGNPSGAAVVTIRSGDEGFESSNCREWERIN